MRLRRLTAVAAAVLAVAGLAGCRTNVGTAAVVDGHRITETDVNDYLTPDAQPVQQQGVSAAPRSFVLGLLIYEREGLAIVKQIPGFEKLTSAQLDSRLTADLGDRTPKQVAEQQGLRGFRPSFYRIALRVQELSSIIQSAAGQLGAAKLNSIIRHLHFPVTVNPRYGSWDKTKLSFDNSPVVPDYLSVAPGE